MPHKNAQSEESNISRWSMISSTAYTSVICMDQIFHSHTFVIDHDGLHRRMTCEIAAMHHHSPDCTDHTLYDPARQSRQQVRQMYGQHPDQHIQHHIADHRCQYLTKHNIADLQDGYPEAIQSLAEEITKC